MNNRDNSYISWIPNLCVYIWYYFLTFLVYSTPDIIIYFFALTYDDDVKKGGTNMLGVIKCFHELVNYNDSNESVNDPQNYP